MFGFFAEKRSSWVHIVEVLRLLVLTALIWGLMDMGFELPSFALPLTIGLVLLSLGVYFWVQTMNNEQVNDER